MAILPPTKGSRRRPSFRGNILQDTTRGVERTRVWPGPRGVLQTPDQKDQNEWFRQVNWAFKFMAPQLQAAFRRATQGTALYPRDLLSIIAANGLVRRVNADGKMEVPFMYMQAVSESLDTISQQPGMQLIRGLQFWEPAPRNTPVGQLVSRAILNTNIAAATGPYPIPWQAMQWDELGMWNVAAPTKLIVPAGVSRLSVGANMYVSGGSPTNFAISIRQNGVVIAFSINASGFVWQAASIATGQIPVAENDEIELWLQLGTAASKSIDALASNLWAQFG